MNFTSGEHGGYQIDLAPIADEIGGKTELACAFSTHARMGAGARIEDGRLFVPLYGYEGAFYKI